jgi:hypothetical protein
MKKTFKVNIFALFVALMLASSTASTAQNLSLGARFGYGVSRVSAPAFSDRLDFKYIPTFSAGITGEMNINEMFAFQPELNYTEKGFGLSLSETLPIAGFDLPLNARTETRVRYIEMPLLGKIKFGNEDKAQAYLTLGPTIGYGLQGNMRAFANVLVDIRLYDQNFSLNSDFQRFELGGMIGAGVQIPVGAGKIYLDGRFSHGFTYSYRVPIVGANVRTQNLNASIGYVHSF